MARETAKLFRVVCDGQTHRVDLHIDSASRVLALTGRRPNVMSTQFYDVPLDLITASEAFEEMSGCSLSQDDRHETVFANIGDHVSLAPYVTWIQTGTR